MPTPHATFPPLRQIRGDLDPERLNPWIKVVVLRLLLEKNPLVMWVDADVMFRDMEWDIHAFMSEYFTGDVDMLTAHDMVCPCYLPFAKSRHDLFRSLGGGVPATPVNFPQNWVAQPHPMTLFCRRFFTYTSPIHALFVSSSSRLTCTVAAFWY
jgi:hypothetical protein